MYLGGPTGQRTLSGTDNVTVGREQSVSEFAAELSANVFDQSITSLSTLREPPRSRQG